MLGNAAVARGLYEAGCCVISSYPGTPSTEITEEAAKFDDIYCEWAPNEKVAMETAFGACLAGKCSFCGMKHVGLNVAADPLFTLSYTGVRGGMVIGVADDAGMHSSQNEQDSRHYQVDKIGKGSLVVGRQHVYGQVDLRTKALVFSVGLYNQVIGSGVQVGIGDVVQSTGTVPVVGEAFQLIDDVVFVGGYIV